MGCDIHVYTQARSGEGPWAFVENEPSAEMRNYAIFTALAGVRRRDDVAVIAPPRGFPKGFHHPHEWRFEPGDDGPGTPGYTVEQFCTDDGHSASYLYAYEIEAYANALSETLDPFLHEWFHRMRTYLAGLGPSTDVRIVFWFDN